MTGRLRKSAAFLGFVLLNTAAFATHARASAPDAAKTVRLQYSRAELSQPGGAERVYRRIQRAAHEVCDSSDVRDLALNFHSESCFERAVDNAVAAIDATPLTALHRSHTQRTASG